jgi:hypothetical protein
MTDETQERLWQEVYDARRRYFESVLGPPPNETLKMLNMTGVWPGGGLYVIPASKIGHDTWVYTPFGLSNHGMSAGIALTKTEFADGKVKATLEKREPALRAEGAAGYGNEILLATKGKEDWPVNFLQCRPARRSCPADCRLSRRWRDPAPGSQSGERYRAGKAPRVAGDPCVQAA